MSAPPIDIALGLLAAGVSVVPIKPDGSKAAAVPSWKECQERLYSTGQARGLWVGRVRGVAAVCGLVSGGLEVIDFDRKDLFGPWSEAIAAEVPGLLERLVIVDTPGGVHCWYRCAEIEGNQKLARDDAGKTTIETRGEGGYAILPGSPAECHPSGQLYAYSPIGLGDLALVQFVAESERALMLDLARSFNSFAELPKGAARPPEGKPGEISPWDDFDARGPGWEDILTPHGWTLVRGTWDSGHLARPGQERKGWAATVGVVRTKAGVPLFHPFSANAGIPVGSYGKARAWIQLNHPGDYKAAAAALRQLGYGTPRGQAASKPAAAAPNGQTAEGPKPWTIKPASGPSDLGISAAALMKLDIPPARFAVDGLLCEGLTVFGGRPKMGKSWLSLLIAWAVAGGHTLDGRECKPGHVLLLALEDTRRRLQSRLKMLGGALGWPFPETLDLRTSWPRADQGGLYHLAEWLSDRKDGARLIIIDTLQRFRRPPKGNGNSYAEDYEALSEIKQLVDMYQTSAKVVHHTRKMPAEDPFDELSGTLGVSGAADGLMVLDRRRGASEGKLFVTGRDVSDATIPLTLDRASFRWSLGVAAEGIDVTGRHASPAANKVDMCQAWLREFLREYAYPSGEITVAARDAGFSFSTLKEAKAELGREGTGEVVNRNYGGGGAGNNDWWAGLGPWEQWTKRPNDLRNTKNVGTRGGTRGPTDSPKSADLPKLFDEKLGLGDSRSESPDGPDFWPGGN